MRDDQRLSDLHRAVSDARRRRRMEPSLIFDALDPGSAVWSLTGKAASRSLPIWCDPVYEPGHGSHVFP